MSDFETSLRFEVKGFTYRFTIGIDEGVFECDPCGALVPYRSLQKHRNHHTLLNVLLNSGVMA